MPNKAIADTDRAAEFAARCHALATAAKAALPAYQDIARLLGGQIDGKAARFGFWTPELDRGGIADADIFLELLSAPDLDLTKPAQQATFARTLIPAVRKGAYTFAAATGATAGARDRIGDFYSLIWRDNAGEWHRIFDPLAMSLPFGVFAPAELYDIGAMQAARTDKAYFQAVAGKAPHKFGPRINIQQIHIPTATSEGTLAALTRKYERLAAAVTAGDDIAPEDQLFLGYDAVQPLPVEPTTVYEAGPDFWQVTAQDDTSLTADLHRPDTTNWGYDIVISGMAAVNPTLLETGRPDELADFAAALHNFPGQPKMLIFDVVYGHSDNQGLRALPADYFAGANMYGQNLDYLNLNVRAILLEMQRRKVNFGADGVRVDGAQDFKWYDAENDVMVHDDDYLQSMSDVVQEVAGTEYRPWFIFEDGRPWPKEDWELSSTYRAVTEMQKDDDVFQWGPLSFAHNTPFLYTFWLGKFWRMREMLDHGSHWISGTNNHDTLRRGTQVNPKLNINTRLGNTPSDILSKAYDNPVVSMLTYAAMPGVPMDFLQASARAKWGFIRNQDDRYGVKVFAEEAISLKWQVSEADYAEPANFARLKAAGYATRAELARFLEFLPGLVEATDYDLDDTARLLAASEPPLAGPTFTARALKDLARAWMDDMHDYCNVTRAYPDLDPAQTAYNLALRQFRHARPWLRGNTAPPDHFDYLRPIDARTIFTSLRHGPDGEQVYAVMHMEGEPSADIDPLTLPVPGLDGGVWWVALRTPNIGSDYTGGPIRLKDSMGVVFTRRR